MKLWHDDIRRPPEGWRWARTNDEAKRWLSTRLVSEVSLDHDLGLHDADPDDLEAVFGMGQAPETGLDLVRWMIDHFLVPEVVTIHSWNPPGAEAMAAALARSGYSCAVRPFRLEDRR